MIPKLFKNGVEIIAYKKNGRTNIAYLADGTELLSGSLKNIECVCSVCDRTTTINFRAAILDKAYICQSCNKKGEKNPFYGKSHTDEFKNNHSELMKGRYVGEKNPFYGRIHSEKTIEILRETCGRSGEDNGFYGKTHTEEFKKSHSVFMRTTGQRSKEYYSAMGIRSVSKRPKKTSIERKTEEKLTELGVCFKYNFILNGIAQYDFLINDTVILEVHGDYWHGNPKMYSVLTERQQYKQARDIEKKKLAEEFGYKYLVIWESQIKEKDWRILNEIY
jgi:G:T-mismatch repair DNA endonuclease (very short patch repair protein)